MAENSSTSSERPKRSCKNKSFNLGLIKKRETKEKERQLQVILKKDPNDRSEAEKKVLKKGRKIVKIIEKRAKLKEDMRRKSLEVEDTSEDLEAKTAELADVIANAEHLVVYTGAGISTAASIPDYRGPNGVWTLLQQGKETALRTHSLVDAEPTLTHMALVKLVQEGKVKHIVSQNCDGLHLRSGIPPDLLSEVHGNMYIEVCIECDPDRQYIRLFDVTERTSLRRHKTGRRCHKCGEPLRDTIVHFGEKGAVDKPLNWAGAMKAAEDADVILCLGSSLKVLRRYQCLWNTDRPKQRRPQLYIVNLQWTPKDSQATLKINGRCDDVINLVMKHLGLQIPQYSKPDDPIFQLATPLRPNEKDSYTTKCLSVFSADVKSEGTKAALVKREPGNDSGSDSDDTIILPAWEEISKEEGKETKQLTQDGTEDSKIPTNTPGWFGKGYRKRRKVGRRRQSRTSSVDSTT